MPQGGSPTGRIEAWLQVRGADQRVGVRLVDALRSAGLHVDPDPSSLPGRPGLLLFDHDAHALEDDLRELSRDALDPVLAIAVSPAALDRETPWRLLAAGAADVLALDGTRDAVGEVVARLRRWREIDEVLTSPTVAGVLIGESPAFRKVIRQIVEIARWTTASILITGESGTGKELVARLVHAVDQRSDKAALVLVDCTTVVPTLSGSEFFGHERGSFTGAISTRDGAFAEADGGTLFLDEIGELSPALQAELLRVVQEGTYKRVGSNAWRHTSFRLVCATNRDLGAERDSGAFRNDLYYRIATWSCRLPSLRERPEDIMPLARHFLAELSPGVAVPSFEPPVIEFLRTRRYPGNIRELRQLILRVATRHVGPGPITVGDLPEEERAALAGHRPGWPDPEFTASVGRGLALGMTLREIREAAASVAVRVAISEEDGNLKRASRRLGVTDRALQLRKAADRIGRVASMHAQGIHGPVRPSPFPAWQWQSMITASLLQPGRAGRALPDRPSRVPQREVPPGSSSVCATLVGWATCCG